MSPNGLAAVPFDPELGPASARPSGYITVFAGKHARADCFNPLASKLWVKFDPVRSAPRLVEPAPQNMALQRGYANLLVQTAQNDYYVNPDLEALREALFAFSERYAFVSTLAFSMGGFGALLLSRALRLRQAVLVSPHRNHLDRVGPKGLDLNEEAMSFVQGGRSELAGVAQDLKGLVLFDPKGWNGCDQAYARAVGALAPQMKLLALAGGGHPATGAIAEVKRFAALQRAIFQDEVSCQEVRDLHRKCRKSAPKYQQMLNDYRKLRANRA